MTHYQIVRKLIGEVDPIADSAIDANRFKNLNTQCELVEALLTDIKCISFQSDSNFHSVKKAADLAKKFLISINEEISSLTSKTEVK